MGRSRRGIVVLLAFPLLVGVVACPAGRSNAGRPDAAGHPAVAEVTSNPHARGARHPAAVERLMRLLPRIPKDGSYEQVRSMLGLDREPDGFEGSVTDLTEVWDIAPGYRFELCFGVEIRGGRDPVRYFASAGFSAQNKPGLPPRQYHTIYPYRARQGMAYDEDELVRLTVR
jgi:hypothetical protein